MFLRHVTIMQKATLTMGLEREIGEKFKTFNEHSERLLNIALDINLGTYKSMCQKLE